MSRRYTTIYIYLIKETISSFIVAFAFFFFIFFINQILLIAEKILAEKVPVLDVINLLIFYLPQVITMAFPFSALVAALMAIGRFSSDNEILALRATGISLARIFFPLFMLSFVFVGGAYVINDYYAPISMIKSTLYYKEIMTTNPAIEFEPYTVKKFNDILITNGAVKGNVISDLVIMDKTTRNEKRIITAGQAVLRKNESQEGVISLELSEVFSHVASAADKGKYEYTLAETMIYNILINDVIGGSINTDAGPRGMLSLDLWKVVKEKTAALKQNQKAQIDRIALAFYELTVQLAYADELAVSAPQRIGERLQEIKNAYQAWEKEQKVEVQDRSLRIYEMEFHRRFSHPFACLVFIVFAFPVGLFARKSGRSVGFAIGVIMSGFYWAALFVFYRLGVQVDYPTVLMSWMPNIIILVFGLIIFSSRLRD